MQVDGTTMVVGIIGDPVAHSLSPLMQNAAIEAAGIDAIYVPFHVKSIHLEQSVLAIRALGMTGINVTIPHKQAVMPYLDDIDASAQLIGAVNTIVNRHDRLAGYNTDGQGFIQSLRFDLDFSPAGQKVVLLGAGGAARSAIVALAEEGAAEIVIANRTVASAESLVEEFSVHFPEMRLAALPLEAKSLNQELENTELLVNTTSLGLRREDLPFPVMRSLPAGSLFYDMVYTPDLTPLQQDARKQGVKWSDGRGMLVGQGEAAFRLWFDSPAPEGVMRQQVKK